MHKHLRNNNTMYDSQVPASFDEKRESRTKYRGIKASIQLTKQWCLTEVTSYKRAYIYLQQHMLD